MQNDTLELCHTCKKKHRRCVTEPRLSSQNYIRRIKSFDSPKNSSTLAASAPVVCTSPAGKQLLPVEHDKYPSQKLPVSHAK
mmetsp:Transcript_95609/g.160602  ORF Transcript_95609/g.160602 Transcript_95609/m.160602 type:complete len:82 (-) Transcript_95609:2404-2649(-)